MPQELSVTAVYVPALIPTPGVHGIYTYPARLAKFGVQFSMRVQLAQRLSNTEDK